MIDTRWRIGGLVLLVLSACSTPTKKDQLPTAAGQISVVRQVSWPAGGSEVTIKLSNAQGGPFLADASQDFSLVFSDESQALLQVEHEVMEPGFTALLIRPAQTQLLREEQQQELLAFVQSRPALESIALFIWLDQVKQLSAFTTNRDRIHGQLSKLPTIVPVATPLPDAEALALAEAQVMTVGGKAPRAMRALVVAASQSPTLAPQTAAVFFDVSTASTAIDSFAASSYYRVSLCADIRGQSGQLRVKGVPGLLPLAFPAALPETSTFSCSPAKFGPGLRQYPEQIDLLFTAAQRETYDRRTQSLSKADFSLSISLDGSAPILATAHLRGKGTLGCVRKSYTLALNGPGRHLLPESRTDEFYALSMCADDRYVQQYVANLLMHELGLFPLQFRYIQLLLDGQTQGIYLLLEKPREELVRDSSGVQAVLRRRFDASGPTDYFESKFSTGLYDEATTYANASKLLESAQEHIDIDQYLRFLALMTAYQNGDYIDEIWVTASEQMLQGGVSALWFQTMAWDNDDLFSECHYASAHAFVDANQLVYCAEAGIDHYLLSIPALYARYIDTLETLLRDQVTPDRFDMAVDTTEAAIMPLLAQPGVSAAMVRLVKDNPAAIDATEAQRDVASQLQQLRSNYRARHSLLIERIATYRGANP